MVKAEKRTLDIFTRAHDRLSKPFKTMGKGIATFAKRARARLNTISKALTSMKAAVGALAVAFGARKLFAGIKTAADELDELVKISQRVGVTVEALQELKFIAGLAGTELNQLTAGLVVFSKNVEQARQGVILKRQAMETLGVTFEDVAGESLDIIGILQKVSKAWDESTSATERNNAIAELFGRTGSKLGPILEAGARGIAAQAKEAHQLGAVFSKDELNRAAEFNDSLLRLTTTMKALADTVFVEVAPELSATFDAIREHLIKNKESVKESLKSMARSIADFTLVAAQNLHLFADAFSLTFSAWVTFTASLEKATLESVLFFQKLSGAAQITMNTTLLRLNKVDRKLDERAATVKAVLDKTLKDIQESVKETRREIDRLGEELPKLRPVISTARPTIVVAEASDEFAEIIRDLEIRQLSSYERQVAALTVRYDKERAKIDERAEALRATTEQQKRAQELLRAEYEKTRESLEGGFFQGAIGGFKKMVEAIRDATSAGRQFAQEVGSAITNEGVQAINDWVDGTKSLKQAWKDLGKSIQAELQRIIVKTLVLRAIGGVFSFAGSVFGEEKAEGGITRPILKPRPLKRYAAGGIATGPQFALFGEGRKNEAFVPLPDGRTIPVTMTGGGGGGVTIINYIRAIDARSVAAFFEENTRTLTAIYDRALITRTTSRRRVRGAA